MFFPFVYSISVPTKSYAGHQLVRFFVENQTHLQQLKQVQTLPAIQTWSELTVGNVDLLIPSSSLGMVSDFAVGIRNQTIIQDVNQVIHQQAAMSAQRAATPDANFFTDYHDLNEIESFLSALPGVRRISIGTTFEQREIPAYVFGNGSFNIIYDGGIHAREWIAPAVATYVTQFLTSQVPEAVQLRSQFTFTVIPVMNPDGYAYTRTVDRFWRKNREPNPGNDPDCMGTDINRNFDMEWQNSTFECSEAYPGSAPFSSAEAKALAAYAKSLPNLISYVNLHAYSQLLMYPFSFTCLKETMDASKLESASLAALKALEAPFGTQFDHGSTCKTIYEAHGTTIDYMYTQNVTYSYAIELRDKGHYGFLLPAEQIPSSGYEMVQGLTALWSFVAAQLKF